MTRHLPAFLIFTFAILGCASSETVESTKVLPGEVYQAYDISAGKSYTNITATFRVGNASGATIDLDAPCRIESNGQEMKEIAPFFLKGTTYELNSNEFVSEVHFKFTAADGSTYENQTKMIPIEISEPANQISRLAKNTIKLTRPLEKDEQLTLSVSSSEAHPANTNSANAIRKADQTEYSIDDPIGIGEGQNSFVIDNEKLRSFKIGAAVLKIIVRKRKNLEQALPKGGEINFSYESAANAVRIVN